MAANLIIYMMTMVMILKMSTFAGMAVAGIVNSLWDLRGRIEGKPVGQWFVAHNDQTIVMMSCRCGESWQNSAPRSKSSSLISRNLLTPKLRWSILSEAVVLIYGDQYYDDQYQVGVNESHYDLWHRLWLQSWGCRYIEDCVTKDEALALLSKVIIT